MSESESKRVGYLGYLTEDQERLLEATASQLASKGKTKEVELYGGNKFLLRFLRAEMTKKGAFKVDASMKRILAFLDWAKEWGYDKPFEKIPEPEKRPVYKQVKPNLVYVDPVVKTVVTIEKFGYTFSNLQTKVMSAHDWESCIGYAGLEATVMMAEAESKWGIEPKGMIAIMDMKGLRLFGVLNRVSFVKTVNSIIAERFPESVDRVFIVNAPKIFVQVFAVMKTFLDPELVAKLSIKSGMPVELLQQTLDVSLLPKEYGGNSDIEVAITTHAN